MPDVPQWPHTHNNNSAAFATEFVLRVSPFRDNGHKRVYNSVAYAVALHVAEFFTDKVNSI